MQVRRSIFPRVPPSKLACAFLLVFQAAFLNVIVPGHTRGIITLAGKSSFTSVSDLGCPLCCQPFKTDSKKTPNSEDKRECAICHLAVRLMPAMVFDFRLGQLGLLEIAPPPAPRAVPATVTLAIHFCRGPPAISV